MIHRDLKPDNVMIGAFGETVVLDWGLAKFANESDAPVSGPPRLSPGPSGPSTHTQDGSILGSPLYMPPEMAEGRTADADQRTDVYLLGATLYEMLTGRPPRQGASRDEILELARTSPPVPPRKIVADIPVALEAVCLKAMSQSRGRRYGTALALADDVQRFLAGEAVTAYREPWWTRAARFVRRHRRAFARAAVIVVIAACAAAGFTYRHRAAELQARELARTQLRDVRRLIDEASFYAACNEAPNELTPFYDPSRGRELAAQARAAVTTFWGADAAGLPLAEDRAALVDELGFLGRFVNAPSASATPPLSPTAPSRALARQAFIEAERCRLESAAEIAAAGSPPSTVRRDQLTQALAVYRSALDQDPTHYWARFQFARCQLALGRTAEAIEALSACIALRPEVPWAFTARAMGLALTRRFEDAHRDLDRALRVAPDFLPAQITRGVVFRLQGDAENATGIFDRLLALPHPPPEAAFYRAHLFLRDSHPEAALEALDRLLADRPGFTAGYLLRAQVLLVLNRPDSASRDLDKLAPRPTPATRGHLLRHLIPQLSTRHQAPGLVLARAQLMTATAAPGADATAFADLGAILHLQGDFRGSVEAITRAIALEQTTAQLPINRGWSYETLDRLEEARSDFARALELDPARAEASAGLAYVEARLKRPAVAQQRAGLALLHGGSDYLVLHNVACTYAQLATADPANAAAHGDAAIALLVRALDLWRSALSGPDERELIAREVAFTALRNRPKFAPLLRSQ